MSRRAQPTHARSCRRSRLAAVLLSTFAATGCAADASTSQTAQPESNATPGQPSAMAGQVQQNAASQTTRPAATGGMPAAVAAVSGGAGTLGSGRTVVSSAGTSGSAAADSMKASVAGTGAAGGGAALSAAGSSAGAAAAGSSAVSSTAGSSGRAAGKAGQAGSPNSGAGQSPVYRIPVRLHVGMSKLTDAELMPILEEMNKIWLTQAGICFEVEVTESETNRSDGFDFRYTSGRIPNAPSANGLTESAHSIWSIDHPQLSKAPNPVMYPTARTTAHELGHALGLAHENPPPSNDCSKPCYCAMRGDNCDDYLLRSGTMGYFLSPQEVEVTRQHAAMVSLSDHAPVQCGMASIKR